MGFEKSFLAVTELVKNFQANENYYLSPEYQEVDVRRDFIDKFFTALGWDVTISRRILMSKKYVLRD
jgi:hypothetical protein